MMPFGKSVLMLSAGPLQGVLLGLFIGWLLHFNKGTVALTGALGFFAGIPLGALEWRLILYFEENRPPRKKKK